MKIKKKINSCQDEPYDIYSSEDVMIDEDVIISDDVFDERWNERFGEPSTEVFVSADEFIQWLEEVKQFE